MKSLQNILTEGILDIDKTKSNISNLKDHNLLSYHPEIEISLFNHSKDYDPVFKGHTKDLLNAIYDESLINSGLSKLNIVGKRVIDGLNESVRELLCVILCMPIDLYTEKSGYLDGNAIREYLSKFINKGYGEFATGGYQARTKKKLMWVRYEDDLEGRDIEFSLYFTFPKDFPYIK